MSHRWADIFGMPRATRWADAFDTNTCGRAGLRQPRKGLKAAPWASGFRSEERVFRRLPWPMWRNALAQTRQWEKEGKP